MIEHKVIAFEQASIDPTTGVGSGYGAVFNNRDDGGDTIAPGFFSDVLPDFLREGFISWSHDWSTPVAMPTAASEDAHGLSLVWQFHSTPAAQDARTVASERLAAGKSMGLSIGYETATEVEGPDGRLLVKAARLFEVGLVMVPMNRLATVSQIKALEEKAAIPPRQTPTSDVPWDGNVNQTNLPNDGGAAIFRRAYAWVDPAADPNTKAAYKFIHHMVAADGTVGAANVVACSTGIAVLNGARGGTTIPDADRQGVWNHLAQHLDDAGRTPPELRGLDLGAGLGYLERLDLVLDEARDLTEHGKARQELRAKEGRVLSAANRDRLSSLSDSLNAVLSDISELLRSTEPAPKTLPWVMRARAMLAAELAIHDINLEEYRNG